MEKRKRRCDFDASKYKDLDGNLIPYQQRKTEKIRGWFHEWGVDSSEHQDPVEPYHTYPIQYTVAICEDDDGFVYLVHPTNVRFV